MKQRQRQQQHCQQWMDSLELRLGTRSALESEKREERSSDGGGRGGKERERVERREESQSYQDGVDGCAR